MRIRRLVAMLCCGLAIPGPARADHLTFVEGVEIDLPTTVEGGDVVLDTPMGRLRVPRGDFARIDPRPDPARDWPKRRADALGADAASRVVAIVWAIDHGLVREAESLLRDAPPSDRSHPTCARLISALDRLASPLPDPDLAPLLRSAPAGHSLVRGPHVLLIHQSTEAEAAERLAHLESIVMAYYLSFAAMGLELPPPRSRLPTIWFARKSDYLAALRDSGADAFGNTRGYYHPTRGLVESYDCRDDPPVRLARQAISARRDDLARFSRSIASLPSGASAPLGLSWEPRRSVPRDEAIALAASLRRRQDRQELLWELARREIDLGVAAHETVHQLVASSRLAPRFDAFPIWLHEGLAMQFETIFAGRWAGLGEPSPIRLREFRRLVPPPSLEATLADLGLRRGYDRDAYARSWSLVFFLRTSEPARFVSLLDALRLPPVDGEDAVSRARRQLLPSGPKVREPLEAAWHSAAEAIAPAARSTIPSPGFN